MGTVTIKNSDFRDNLGSTVSTLYAYDTTLSLQNNAFNNPSNVTIQKTVTSMTSDHSTIKITFTISEIQQNLLK